MTRWLGLDTLMRFLLRKIMFLWVRTVVLPEGDSVRGSEPGRPAIYLLERDSLADLLVLDEECIRLGLPRPVDGLEQDGLKQPDAALFIRHNPGWLYRRKSNRQSQRLRRLLETVRANEDLDVQLVPVSIFWGRSPDKEKGLLRAFFSEDWALYGRLRKLFTVALHGRDTLVQFSPPVRLRTFVEEGLGDSVTQRKLMRVLRVHYRRLRVATIGPDLSHRRTLVNKLLETREVGRAIEKEMRARNMSRRKAMAVARRYANEIAANYSYPVIRVSELLLNLIWQRLYEGIELNNFSNVQAVAEGNEIIYVPCHRSHIDYLLLSYVLLRNGLVCPHIAAGINLNMPVLGAYLRGGGAFFIRRSFRGNQLYSAVINQYLALNLAKGVSIEYFVEGGRSRTGRLLAPRQGMLRMTVDNYIRQPRRPLVFVPVYFGYERVVEARTYLGELGGRAKKKESAFDLLRFLPTLRENFGRVFVNFGEPLFMDELLDEQRPGWRDEEPGPTVRPPWLGEVVGELGDDIMRRINSAAAVGPINLLGLVLLAMPRQAMLESDLIIQLELYRALLKSLDYSPWTTITDMSCSEMIAHAERLGAIQRRENPLGDIIHMSEDQAVLMTYYRNNVIHLLAVPSLIACALVNNRSVDADELQRAVAAIYPYLGSELFIRWTEDELAGAVRHVVAVMTEHGLIRHQRLPSRYLTNEADSRQAVRLAVLSRIAEQQLEIIYIVVAMLHRYGSGRISERDLGEQCHFMAQRLTLLFGLDSPEFFDRSLVRNPIRHMKHRGLLSVDDEGLLVFEDKFTTVDRDASLLLSDEMRASIRQVTET